MARTPTFLSPEELAAIATAPSDLTTADLARQLGCHYFTVAKARQRIQQAGGWYTSLTWTICAACGQPLCHGPRKRIVHVACKSKRIAHLAKERRKRGGHATSINLLTKVNHCGNLKLPIESAFFLAMDLPKWWNNATNEKYPLDSRLGSETRQATRTNRSRGLQP